MNLLSEMRTRGMIEFVVVQAKATWPELLKINQITKLYVRTLDINLAPNKESI